MQRICTRESFKPSKQLCWERLKFEGELDGRKFKDQKNFQRHPLVFAFRLKTFLNFKNRVSTHQPTHWTLQIFGIDNFSPTKDSKLNKSLSLRSLRPGYKNLATRIQTQDSLFDSNLIILILSIKLSVKKDPNILNSTQNDLAISKLKFKRSWILVSQWFCKFRLLTVGHLIFLQYQTTPPKQFDHFVQGDIRF